MHALLQGNLPDPRIKPLSPALAGRLFTTGAIWKVPYLSERPSNEMVCIVEAVSSPSLEIHNTTIDARPLVERLEGGSRPGSMVPFLIEGQHSGAEVVVGDDSAHYHGHSQTEGSSLSPLLGHHQLLSHGHWGQQTFLGSQRQTDIRSAQVTGERRG